DHPNNQMVLSGYVMYMIGYCNYRLGPGNFFLFPPDHEKDLSYVQNAYLIFKVFFQRYPQSAYMKKALKYYKYSLGKLSRHEMYVAKFYLKKKKPKGAKLRLEYLVRSYPDAPNAPSAALLLGNLYAKDGEYTKASTILKTVLKKYAGKKEAREALSALAKLKGPKEK
ncbi:outer membrane protein assembly factor BamD, partial [Myxococcota bacterium]|nr:outer membrane protein assembly factor BamD [Myxococcota bacterium]